MEEFYSYSDAGLYSIDVEPLEAALSASYQYAASAEESQSSYTYFNDEDNSTSTRVNNVSTMRDSSSSIGEPLNDTTSSSPSPPQPSKISKSDWNSLFKKYLVMPDSTNKWKLLSQLSKDFAHAAKQYAKLIISELYLPESEKTLKPLDLGGVAGGSKYVAQGILFKFALDLNGMYDGDKNAMKAAGHELKGLMCYYNCHIPDLHLPLMALIDYRGFRVVAVSFLPVSRSSIIYGSSDGGINVHADNPLFNALMKRAGIALNLKPHIAGREPVEIFGPADIEGHLSPDDKCFYLLDFARTMPPQVALSKERSRRHLYELLRPEFVKSNPVPLSSDALTGMAKHDPNRLQHNDEVKEACTRLFTTIIPTFPVKFETKSLATTITPEEARLVSSGDRINLPVSKIDELIQAVHRAGINIRHLGLIRSKATSTRLKRDLLLEMIARVMKDEMYSLLRKTMSKLKIVSDEPYRAAVLKYFNRTFVTKRGAFWKSEVKDLLLNKFMAALSTEEKEPSYNLLRSVDVQNLLVRLGEITAVRLQKDAIPILESGISKIVDTDLLELDAKVKKMNVVSEASAMVLWDEAERRRGSEATRLFQLAINTFKEAISTSPNSHFAFYQLGAMLHRISQKFALGDDSISLLAIAIEKLERAVEIDGSHTEAVLEFADTLLDFATNSRRLWLLYRKDSKQLLQGVNSVIETAAKHLKTVLSKVSDDSTDKGISNKALVRAVEKLLKRAPDIKLLGYVEASLNCQALDPILADVISKKSSIIVSEEGILCFKKEAVVKLVAFASASLEAVSLNHAEQLDDGCLLQITASLRGIKKLKLNGLDTISSLPDLSILDNLRALSLAGTTIFSRLSERQIEGFAGGISRLESLNLSGVAITDAQLSKLLQKLVALTTLKLGKFADPLKNVSQCRLIESPSIKNETLEKLDFSGCLNLKASTLITVSKYVKSLKSLDLAGCSQIGDDAIVAISKKCSTLTYVNLSSTAVADNSIKSLVQSNAGITHLDLELCENVRGSCVRKIFETLKSLERLEMNYWKFDQIEPTVFTSIGESADAPKSSKSFSKTAYLPSLKMVQVCNWKNLADASIARLISASPSLTRINLAGSYALTDATLLKIADSLGPNLVSLGLARCPLISDDGVRALCLASPNLTQLVLDNCTDLTEFSIRVIADRCKKIEELSVANLSRIQNEDIQYLLHRITTLKELNLSGCKSISAVFLFRELRHQCPLLRIVTLNRMKLNGFEV